MKNIPFYRKDNIYDCGCAPVCLRMVFGYFNINKTIDEIYKLAGSIGEMHYTLPWGMCIAGSKVGLYSTFISKNPKELLESSIQDISSMTEMCIKDIERIVRSQIDLCTQSEFIQLLKWRDEFRRLPMKLVMDEGINAVVIPTVWWGRQPHNIVLVGYEHGNFYYHDPNSEHPCQIMPESEFYNKWVHPYTDNDLLIFSKEKLSL